MARNDPRKQEIEDAAATLARFFVGILWDRVNTLSPAESPAGRASRAVNRKEAARMLGLSEKTVARLAERGDIKQVGSGRAKRYPVDQIESYLRRRE